MTELKPTNLIAFEVPQDANYFYLDKIEEDNYELQFISGGAEHGRGLEFESIILGEVTKDEIGFDVEPYIVLDEINAGRKLYLIFGKYYNEPRHERVLSTTDKKEVFKSLLVANGLYFENPLSEPNLSSYEFKGTSVGFTGTIFPNNGYDIEGFNAEYKKWQSFEDKRIKGKLLILEKL
jgi:hypothetical protein